MFVNDQNGVSDKTLYMQHRHYFRCAVDKLPQQLRTEYDPPPNEVFWDGYVLEISSPNISGGDFTDVLDPAVGVALSPGGYTLASNQHRGHEPAGGPIGVVG